MAFRLRVSFLFDPGLDRRPQHRSHFDVTLIARIDVLLAVHLPVEARTLSASLSVRSHARRGLLIHRAVNAVFNQYSILFTLHSQLPGKAGCGGASRLSPDAY